MQYILLLYKQGVEIRNKIKQVGFSGINNDNLGDSFLFI